MFILVQPVKDNLALALVSGDLEALIYAIDAAESSECDLRAARDTLDDLQRKANH